MDRPNSFRPLTRVPNPDGTPGVYLQDPETGDGFAVTHAVTDAADGITDDDFTFAAGEAWSKSTMADEG